MSREQRRLDRKQGANPPPSRRTPQKVDDKGFPVVPLAVAGGIVLVVALIAYLIIQASSGGGESLSASERAEQDSSTDLPGSFYPSQGRGHFTEGLIGHVMFPFCEGVDQSELAGERSGQAFGATPGAATPTASPTPAFSPTPHAPSVTAVPLDCHNSNPPSSGQHLGVQRNIDIGGGKVINIPPDPDVYPHDVEIPRDAIAHALEHAGVYIGWNCADGDQACLDTVQQVEDLANQHIDDNDRVVMAINLDLPVGEIGVASWTRVLRFPYAEYDEGAVSNFISTHSCRFDPEGFC